MSTEKIVLTLMLDSYYGTGGFEFGAQDGALDSQADTRIGSYLVKHPREHVDSYSARRKVAYYLNYMAPVVDSHVSPLFRRETTREWNESAADLWTAFMDDADGAGSTLAQVMREAAMPAKRDGVCFLVVTSPEVAPVNRKEQLVIRPYIYRVEALDVVDLKRDRFGRVVSFSHLESRDGQDEPVVRTLTPNGWSVANDKGEPLESGDFATAYPTAPVVEICTGAKVRGAKLPRSGFVAIARACHRLFNLCSELDEIFRAQTFSILLYPSRDLSELTIGVNNALGFDGENAKHPPSFIAPPDGPAKLLMEQIDRLVREIYRMALLTHQTGSTNSNQQQNLASGVALRIDREALDTALGDFAGTMEKAERQIAALWSWWTSETLEYSVGYPRDFVLQDEATMLQPLLDAWAAILADMPPMLKNGLLKRIGTILLEDDAERLEQLIEYLDQADIDAANTPPPETKDTPPPVDPAADGAGEGGAGT